MSNHSDMLALIRALTGQANVLTIPRLFVRLTGKLETALFLSQLLYWSDKGGRSDGFIYKSRKEWGEELCISKRQITQATNYLKKQGWLETKLHRANGAPTLHYRLNQAALLDVLLRFAHLGKTDLPTRDNQICPNEQNPNIDYTETTKQVGGVLSVEEQINFELLKDAGVTEGMARKLADKEHVGAWVQYAQDHNLGAGFLVSRLKTGEAPPREYTETVEDREERKRKARYERYTGGKYADVVQH